MGSGVLSTGARYPCEPPTTLRAAVGRSPPIPSN